MTVYTNPHSFRTASCSLYYCCFANKKPWNYITLSRGHGTMKGLKRKRNVTRAGDGSSADGRLLDSLGLDDESSPMQPHFQTSIDDSDFMPNVDSQIDEDFYDTTSGGYGVPSSLFMADIANQENTSEQEVSQNETIGDSSHSLSTDATQVASETREIDDATRSTAEISQEIVLEASADIMVENSTWIEAKEIASFKELPLSAMAVGTIAVAQTGQAGHTTTGGGHGIVDRNRYDPKTDSNGLESSNPESEDSEKGRKKGIGRRFTEAVIATKQSAFLEIGTMFFATLVPVVFGAAIFFLVQKYFSHTLDLPKQPNMHPLWNFMSHSTGAANAAGAFAGMAGFGIAAKSTPAVIALVPQMDAIWRSFGGASLVALYWRTLVFGKTFRTVEWNVIGGAEAPDGRMCSVTIRISSLHAVKSKIAAVNSISEGAEGVQQLAMWIPSSPDFFEPLVRPRDLALVPDYGFIVWCRTRADECPLPMRGTTRNKKSSSSSSSGFSLIAQQANMTEEAIQLVQGVSQALEASREVAAPCTCSDFGSGSHVCTCGNVPGISRELRGGSFWDVSFEEENELIDSAVRLEPPLVVLYKAFYERDQNKFLRHALYYVRNKIKK